MKPAVYIAAWARTSDWSRSLGKVVAPVGLLAVDRSRSCKRVIGVGLSWSMSSSPACPYNVLGARRSWSIFDVFAQRRR